MNKLKSNFSVACVHYFPDKKMMHSDLLKEPQFLFNTVKEKKWQTQDFDLVNNNYYYYDQTKKRK